MNKISERGFIKSLDNNRTILTGVLNHTLIMYDVRSQKSIDFPYTSLCVTNGRLPLVSDRTISLRFQNNYTGNYSKEVELWDPVLQQGTEIKAF